MDSKRRLQVLNQQNPSLRVAASPQKASVAPIQAQSPKLTVQAPVSRPAPVVTQHAPVSAPQPKSPGIFASLVKPFQQFGNMVVEGNRAAYIDLPRAIYRQATGDTAGVKQIGDALDARMRGPGYFGGGYPTGFNNGDAGKSFIQDPSKIKSSVGTGLAIGSYVVPGNIIREGVAVTGGKLLPKVIGSSAAGAAGAGTASVGEQLANEGNINLKKTVADTSLGAVGGPALFGLGRALSKGVRAVGGKISEKLGNKSIESISNIIAGQSDPAAIQKATGVDAETAKFLASENNPEVIKAVLGETTRQEGDVMKIYEAGHGAPNQTPEGYKWDPNSEVAPIRVDDGTGIHTTQQEVQAALDSGNPTALLEAINKRSGPIKQDGKSGFVISDKPENIKAGKEIKKIDNELEKVRQGTSTKSAEEVKALVQKRQELVDQASSGTTKNSTQQEAAQAVSNTQDGTTTVLETKAADIPQETSQTQNVAENVNTSADKAAQETKNVYYERKTGNKTTSRISRDQVEAKLAAFDGIPEEDLTAAQLKQKNALLDQKKLLDFNVDEAFPNATPETRQAIRDVLDATDSAQINYNKAEQARKVQTAQKFARADAAVKEAGGGVKGYFAGLKAMGGKMSESNYVPLDASDKSMDEIMNIIDGSGMMSGEKSNTKRSFLKFFGRVDRKPATHDINNVRDFINKEIQPGLGDAMVGGLEDAVKSGRTWQDLATDIAGIPRTLMTIADASAPRQLAVSFAAHPIETTKAYIKSFPEMFSNAKFAQSTEKMAKEVDQNGLNYADFMQNVMKIHLPNLAEKAAEETMSSAPFIERAAQVGKNSGKAVKVLSSPLRGLGHIVGGSNRGMSSAVAGTRFNVIKNFIDNNGGIEAVSKNFSDKELRKLGEVMNTITGRGGADGGFTDRHAKILSETLFSGKLWASRLNMLNPIWYARLPGPARKEAIKSAAAFAASAGAVLTLIDQLPGVDVGKDPRSADFAKIKVGNTRYDILGGFQQNIVAAARLATGQKVNSETGETKDATIANILGGIAEGKLNPLLGFAWQIANTKDNPDSSNPLDRKDEWGNDVNIAKKGMGILAPLNITQIPETANDVGSFAKGAAMTVPGFFGAGVQTYGNIPTKDQGKADATGKKTFNGKITPDMVTDQNGQVILDDKGKVIRVKFKGNETELQKQAMLDEARQKALGDQYRRNLPGEDQALLKLDANQLKSYLESGKIDQAKYDQLEQYQQDIKNINGIELPKGVKTKEAKAFYSKYNSLTDTNKKSFLDGEPTQEAVNLANELNKNRTPGVGEFKASNKLLKLYADFENKINTTENLTDIDRRNAARSFQQSATKLNYSQDQQDIYTEGGSSDLKAMLDSGEVIKEDLTQAIKLDNELYMSGLTDSLKFSKKFRNTYGYSVPSKKGSTGSGSGSGSSKSTGAAKFLPSASGGFKAAPSFKATPRASVRFTPSSSPSASSTKATRVKIKL